MLSLDRNTDLAEAVDVISKNGAKIQNSFNSLIIKLNKFFSFCHQSELKTYSPSFCPVMETLVKVWKNSKSRGNSCCRPVFPQHFLFTQTCFYDLIETQYIFSFLKLRMCNRIIL